MSERYMSEEKKEEDITKFKETLENIERRVRNLETTLRFLDPENLKSRLSALEKAMSAKPSGIAELEKEVQSLRRILTPEPTVSPKTIKELEEEKKALEEVLRPKPRFSTVKEAINALETAREKARQAGLELEVAQLLQKVSQEIDEKDKAAKEGLEKAEEIKASGYKTSTEPPVAKPKEETKKPDLEEEAERLAKEIQKK